MSSLNTKSAAWPLPLPPSFGAKELDDSARVTEDCKAEPEVQCHGKSGPWLRALQPPALGGNEKIQVLLPGLVLMKGVLSMRVQVLCTLQSLPACAVVN